MILIFCTFSHILKKEDIAIAQATFSVRMDETDITRDGALNEKR